MPVVRQATADDVDAFVDVVVAVADEGRWIATEPPVDVDVFTERVHAMLAAGDALFVLDDGGRIIGTAGLHLTRAAGVVSLGVSILARERGSGHGRVMVEALIEHARGMEVHKIELEVWPDNARAIALYESFGFQTEGVRRDHYRRRDGSLRSAQIMALLLQGLATS